MTLKKAIIILMIVISILLIYCVFLASKQTETSPSEDILEATKNKDEEEINKAQIAILKGMTEKQRIQKYFAEYLMHIEAKEYEKAYDLLYPDFKENYFSDLEKYEKYVKKIYPSTIVVEYGNTERQGYYFILNVDIIDPLGKKGVFPQRFVVYENDYNDFVISFEVI